MTPFEIAFVLATAPIVGMLVYGAWQFSRDA